jgi:subtilisin-like proprotein convertase family protein
MKTPFSSLIQLAAGTAVLAALTLAQPAHSAVVETTCTGSAGTNCPAQIPDGPLSGIRSTLTVPANVCGAGSVPTGIAVRVDITHSWIGDLTLSVINPANSTSTLVSSLAGPPAVSCDGDDIAATFQDGAAAATCQSATVPSLSGTVAPASPLAPLASSLAGTWTLVVTDNVHGNNGAINDWAVDVSCQALAPADMGVALSGFPTSATPNTNVTGTVTCTSDGGQAATNATCAVSGGTESNCTLQPANTPIASFPVASVPVGSSITCTVTAPVSALGAFSVTGTTSADVDSNPANNTASVAVGALAPADMAVTLSGFPASAAAGSAIAGTLTCTNVGGGVPATSATCAIASGGTASNCMLQPASTPVASFPVASVAAANSIVCSVAGVMPTTGALVVNATTSASNDNNPANNTATATVAAQTPPPPPPPPTASVAAPALSMLMQAMLLCLLLGTGIWLSRSRGSS